MVCDDPEEGESLVTQNLFLRAGPRKKGAKSGSGSDGVSGEKVRFEPELDHQVGNEQKHKMEPFPIFIDNNQHAEFDKTANF